MATIYVGRSTTLEGLRRRLVRRLGSGKLVAVDPKTGVYVVASDLDSLVRKIPKEHPSSRRRHLRILRLGHRAAIELRGQR